MNAGALDNMQKGAIVRVLCDKSGIRSDKIGTIDILREFTFFDIENSVAAKVLKSMKGAQIDGKDVRVQYAAEKKKSKKSKHKKY